ncbi:MAG: serine/threonine protein kinase [Labilithrix sp.]|nr:serine/threonine protein kinase [Labilithrix sp.]
MTRSARDIGGYRLVAGLGEGGMARVYLALSKKTAGFNKLLVLKVIRSSVSSDPELRRMFFDEARVAALLNHPNVVQTYEAGEDEGRLFLAMEYLEGRSLSAILASNTAKDTAVDVQLRIIADMLLGLHYAHTLADVDGVPLAVVHRDVSPQNVFVTYSGQAKIVDFGIAKIAGSPHTESGIIKGKVGYIAPEQIHGKELDRRADVFSAGVMIWEAIAKRRLAPKGESEAATLGRRMTGGDPSIRSVAPEGTDEELLAICDKAMMHAPDARYATALELHEALDAHLRRTGGADAKQVAALMETAFGEDRARRKRTIEDQLKVADQSLPLLDVPKQTTITLTAPVSAPASDPRPSTPPSLPALDLGASIETVVPTDGAHVADLSMPRARPRRRALFAGAAAIAIVATAILGVRASFAPSRGVAAAAAASSVPEAAPPEALPKLVIRTTPDSASLVIDGDPVSTPYQGRFPRGARVHVAANAPSFAPYERTIVVEEDLSLDVALAPISAPPRTAAPAARPPPRGKPARRTIDDEDPYRR